LSENSYKKGKAALAINPPKLWVKKDIFETEFLRVNLVIKR